MRNTKPQVVCEFIFDIRQPKQNKELTEKFKTGEFVLFGFIPEKGWRKVWYQSIGSVDKYKLVRKKVYPINLTCGSCAYYEDRFCCHANSKDNCGDRDLDKKCDIGCFVSIPYNWSSYTSTEKETFRIFKQKNKKKEI